MTTRTLKTSKQVIEFTIHNEREAVMFEAIKTTTRVVYDYITENNIDNMFRAIGRLDDYLYMAYMLKMISKPVVLSSVDFEEV